LRLPRIRFLLADDPGAGKTIMAGLLIKELKVRGLVKRILIVTPGQPQLPVAGGRLKGQVPGEVRSRSQRRPCARITVSNPWQEKKPGRDVDFLGFRELKTPRKVCSAAIGT